MLEANLSGNFAIDWVRLKVSDPNQAVFLEFCRQGRGRTTAVKGTKFRAASSLWKGHTLASRPLPHQSLSHMETLYILACILCSHSLTIITPSTSFPPQALACQMIPSWRNGKAVLSKTMSFEESQNRTKGINDERWSLRGNIHFMVPNLQVSIVKIKHFFLFLHNLNVTGESFLGLDPRHLPSFLSASPGLVYRQVLM